MIFDCLIVSKWLLADLYDGAVLELVFCLFEFVAVYGGGDDGGYTDFGRD